VPQPRATSDDLSIQDEEDAGRVVTDDATVIKLLSAAGPPRTELAARNRAIILMLAESGMRVGELCRLRDTGVDLQERTAWIRGSGGRRRAVFWGPETAAALGRYLLLRGEGEGVLFCGLSSRNRGAALTPGSVRRMIKGLAKRAGIALPKGAPVHSFRAFFAQRMLEAGIDGLELQQLMGHADIRTTSTYTARDPAHLRAVHQRAFARPLTEESMPNHLLNK
jgi:integrase/recombinase XerD